MALVAVDAVVHVPADTLVLRISICFRVAVGTGEYRVIVGIGVAGRAHTVSVPMVNREVGMVPVGRDPRRGVMASGAGGRKSGRRVVRIGRSGVIGLVARVAVRRQGRVIVVYVTAGARNVDMEAGQRKRRVVVIEAGRDPSCRVVTHVALLRESRGDVIRIGRALKILQVTAHAGRAGEVIVVVYMARGTWGSRVRSRQRETGSGMIKRCRLPRRRAVAHFAGLRESLLRMVGIVRVLIILQVTRHTGLHGKIEIPARVALVALQAGMRAG